MIVIFLNKSDKTILTSFVLRLGVERDELEPDRDGGRSLGGFELLLPGLSCLSPFKPILSRSRSLDSIDDVL